MLSRRVKMVVAAAVAIMCCLLLCLPGCSGDGSQGYPDSFEDTWAASLAAVEALGPVRVTVVETTDGRWWRQEDGPQEAQTQFSITGVEELLDPAGGRARLTVHEPDGATLLTVVNRSERFIVTHQPNGSGSYDHSVSSTPRAGLPLPLFDGGSAPMAPTTGYTDLFTPLGSGGEGMIAERTAERLQGGRHRLILKRTSEQGESTVTVLLGRDLLPVRIDIDSEGEGSGELEGVMLDVLISYEYSFRGVSSFSDSDFTVDVPLGYQEGGVTLELSLDRPWGENLDSGQYWLGRQMGEWSLIDVKRVAGLDVRPTNAGEFVWLLYERRGIKGDEALHLTIGPLLGIEYEETLADAEERVGLGGWKREQTTLAGVAATVYSGLLQDDAGDRADWVYIVLPDAFVQIRLPASVEPEQVLEAFCPVE
jgi:hypothetical protein